MTARTRNGTAGSLLIYAPVPLYEVDGTLHLEDQACNGLRLWAEHFDRVLVMMPVEPGPPPPSWRPISEVGPALDRIEIHRFPTAYRPDRFFRHLPSTGRRIRSLIGRARYLSFSIGGLFGDWGSVACWQAHRMKRPYAVWTDRVESEVVRRTTGKGPLRSRIKSRLYHRPMAWLEKTLIRRASLGLFHGRETFETYAPYCGRPEVVHDVHVATDDHIPADALAAKLAGAADGPLRICYVGRMDPMKGPDDWVGVLERLSAGGVDFRAIWLGDGTEEERIRQRVAESGLGDRVDLPGFVADREAVLKALREAHIFLFCHKTPESPRCLIEALVSGSPIVGYESAFPDDLISDHGGGRLVARDDVDALAAAVIDLGRDRQQLTGLIQASVRDGAPFNDVEVFRHRSELIKRHL